MGRLRITAVVWNFNLLTHPFKLLLFHANHEAKKGEKGYKKKGRLVFSIKVHLPDSIIP
jgi:hypothetical protein